MSDQSTTPPSLAHPFGTDRLGDDSLARTMSAATLEVSITVAVGAALSDRRHSLGKWWAGFFRSWFDYLTMRILEVCSTRSRRCCWRCIVSAVAGPGPSKCALFVVALLPLPDYVRLGTCRGQVHERTGSSPRAAKLVGRRPVGVLFAHLVPNSLRPLLTYGVCQRVASGGHRWSPRVPRPRHPALDRPSGAR
jgi:peptide/nickel transport system permease protein